ncbi:hypothetical protein ACIA58_03545 [Kribbella sp. NPDC051586]|uniref:hypothetical protein n=1 Tax=Kribbella sp. NPDC051586 TaxID=3364118 RepID=UPI0037BDA34C
MKPISATASRRPPWQNPRHRRQAVAGLVVLLLGCLVLVLLGIWGRGPEPASPVAGLQPGQPTQNVPAIPRTATPTPGATPTVLPTQLPTATTPGGIQVSTGHPTAPYSTLAPATPVPQIAETTGPTTSVTRRPPTVPPTVPPTAPPTAPTTVPSHRPTTTPSGHPTKSTPTEPPPTSTTPTSPPTTPDDPDHPGGGGLVGLLGSLLDKLGL